MSCLQTLGVRCHADAALLCQELRLKVFPFDKARDEDNESYQRRLKISAAGITHEYPFVVASFGTRIDGDVQWNGDIEEYGNDERRYSANNGKFALLKRGERSYIEAARKAQKDGARACVCASARSVRDGHAAATERKWRRVMEMRAGLMCPGVLGWYVALSRSICAHHATQHNRCACYRFCCARHLQQR